VTATPVEDRNRGVFENCSVAGTKDREGRLDPKSHESADRQGKYDESLTHSMSSISGVAVRRIGSASLGSI